jgi:hypothetical protein
VGCSCGLILSINDKMPSLSSFAAIPSAFTSSGIKSRISM